ncbi:MAG: bifunctional UDP-N-acetylglucosamine diphosphorylase/glucosamine-1-phosphate N-acetyltransferase GlmU [Rhodospirillales bacterium]|nr:bifunctional UDP-N-acetylglucosamine diphosphorylase/glucosamine-1-phosphate N-acetyltransferase GlmU [Rhodospirillales bacterium]MDH3792622.1 bifunctional UDP-N-acetylglucosamine diphosphorylase/glucosamine-1-phosphate N-acetyltransferase GlmU [Rhodospirillales bacterium]MDH3912545.1 bifunctional UDP-N-acetylglucosamine diphosphorylase/glucosamine-1-phosphate N-acetyltransferase GlmU [Rhodospirillales bacterium]MDH3918050.1 bifunctional UDP-N-acetylglucosamine diphosphorylase/glucosamine-1-p
MTESKLAVVILAAGKGVRMVSRKPKVLHEVAGKAMLHHVLDAVAPLAPERIVVVSGPGMEQLAEAARPHPTVVQEPQLGTGHAVLAARPALDGFHGDSGAGHVLVLFGDTPLVTTDTLARMVQAVESAEAPALVALGFRSAEPGYYGRMVLDPADGRLLRIVEAADAGPEELSVTLCNGGVMLGRGPELFALLDRVGNDNAKGEYYLTDIYALAAQEGLAARVIETEEDEILGVNARAELAIAEAVMQRRLRDKALAGGATLLDPMTVWFSHDTRLGPDVTVEPGVFFGPGVNVGEGAVIRAFSHLEGADVAAGAVVGPYARLRPGARLQEGARVGNFVEVKNAVLGVGAKANHLTYLGDATVGAGANIGAGTITCNYDGFAKHRTEIGEGVFVGSNTALVAPVALGPGAMVAAGSTVTKDVAADALAVARGQQRTVEGGAALFRARKRKNRPKE